MVGNVTLILTRSAADIVTRRFAAYDSGIGPKIYEILSAIDSRNSRVSAEGSWITANYEGDNVGYQAIVQGGGEVHFYRGSSVEEVKSNIKKYLESDFAGVSPNSIILSKIEAVDSTMEFEHDYIPYVPETTALSDVDTALRTYSYEKLYYYKVLFDAADRIYSPKRNVKISRERYLQAKKQYEAMIAPRYADYEGSYYYEEAKRRIGEINLALNKKEKPVLTDRRARYRKGVRLMKQGDTYEAEGIFKNLVAFHYSVYLKKFDGKTYYEKPDKYSFLALVRLGDIHRKDGDCHEAHHYYQEARELYLDEYLMSIPANKRESQLDNLDDKIEETENCDSRVEEYRDPEIPMNWGW